MEPCHLREFVNYRHPTPGACGRGVWTAAAATTLAGKCRPPASKCRTAAGKCRTASVRAARAERAAGERASARVR
eukprot:9950926-Karenia_brevis.AAC.1